MDVSGTSMASYAVTMWSALFGAHPSSLCVTGTSLLLRVFNSVRAVTWLCMDNGRTRPSAKCATTRCSFVFYSYLSVRPRTLRTLRAVCRDGHTRAHTTISLHSHSLRQRILVTRFQRQTSYSHDPCCMHVQCESRTFAVTGHGASLLVTCHLTHSRLSLSTQLQLALLYRNARARSAWRLHSTRVHVPPMRTRHTVLAPGALSSHSRWESPKVRPPKRDTSAAAPAARACASLILPSFPSCLAIHTLAADWHYSRVRS